MCEIDETMQKNKQINKLLSELKVVILKNSPYLLNDPRISIQINNQSRASYQQSNMPDVAGKK